MNYLSVTKYDFETTSNVIKNQSLFCSRFSFILMHWQMRNRHLNKLTGNARYIYLFALDSTNSMEMKELDIIAKPKN